MNILIALRPDPQIEVEDCERFIADLIALRDDLPPALRHHQPCLDQIETAALALLSERAQRVRNTK